MTENVAESGRKRSKSTIEKKMQEADELIANGATREQAAAQINLPARTFYRYYSKWQEQKYEELKDKFKQRIHQYLIRQDHLYSKALESERIGVAAQINDRTMERLQSLGLAPKAEEKAEVSNQIGWKEIWESMHAKRSKNVQSV